jgi:hypothetical protein
MGVIGFVLVMYLLVAILGERGEIRQRAHRDTLHHETVRRATQVLPARTRLFIDLVAARLKAQQL